MFTKYKMTMIGQRRTFQIYIDGTAQATKPITYDTKLDSGRYFTKITNVSILTTTATGVEHQIRSGFLINSLGNLPYLTVFQAPDSAVPVSPVMTAYEFGALNLQQYLDLWIVDKSTGLPEAGLLSAILTFEVERIE
jgi:hypothetical protein